MTLLDWLAIASSAAVVGSYMLLAFKMIPPHVFHWANFLGAPAVCAVSAQHGAWQPFFLTAFFGMAGMTGLLVHYRVRERLSDWAQDA